MKIEKGIPIPDKDKGFTANFRLLEVGDSILFDFEEEKRARNNIWRFKNENPGFNYTTRKVDDGIRIWRTA